jgi:hypothetical protein
MTLPVKNYSFPFGLTTPAPPPVISQRSPTVYDSGYQLGTLWVNTAAGLAFILISDSPITWGVSAGSSNPGSITWINNATSQAMQSNYGYIVTAGVITLSLPILSNVGDVIQVLFMNGTSWTISQAGGQYIRFADVLTTVGPLGSLSSNSVGDSVTMVCTVADTAWEITSSIGNPKVI